MKCHIFIIDYIKPGHEGLQLHIEYYNEILAVSTHKIYTKSISLVSQKPYFILLLHFLAFTQCFKGGPKVFGYRNFLVVLSPTFGAQSCTTLSADHILLWLNHAPP